MDIITSSDATVPPDSSEKERRVNWIDYAKGIGISLVVVGHALRGLVDSLILEPSALIQFVDTWIYAFHMPLFFFISGLFISHSASKSFKNFLIDKLQTIAYPYFVWAILQELIRKLVGVDDQPIQSIWHILYAPPMQFWFLYILLILSLSYTLFRKIGLSTKAFAIAACLLHAADLLNINFGPWGVLNLLQLNAIYFAGGAVLAEFSLINRIDKFSPFCMLASTVTGFFCMTVGVLFVNEFSISVPILAFMGTFSTLFLAKFLKQFKIARFLEQWGLLSLQIFVAHTIFSAATRIVLQKVFHSSVSVTHIAVGILVGIYGPIGLYLICQKFKFPYAFTLRLQKAGSKN